MKCDLEKVSQDTELPEKATIIRTSEGDETYSVYTFNAALKRRLADFTEKYPTVCRLEKGDEDLGWQSYIID